MTLTTVAPTIARDGKGRPMVYPPNGTKPTAYTRCTTYVDALEDKYNLQKWQQRMVILGLVDRPDLLLSAAAHRGDKDELNRIAEASIEAAKAGAAATVGTAIHELTHRLDRGEDVGFIPGDYQRDLDAYRASTATMRMLLIETFTVQDELKIGGTPDRVVEYDGGTYIADIKTGSIDFGVGKMAMQLAVYAHSELCLDGKTRAALPNVSRERGIIIHLPAGTGTCQLHWINIAAGWEAVQIATQVRKWCSRRDLSKPIDEFTAAVQAITAAGLEPVDITDPIVTAINHCTTAAELGEVWKNAKAKWTSDHTALAAQKKLQLSTH